MSGAIRRLTRPIRWRWHRRNFLLRLRRSGQQRRLARLADRLVTPARFGGDWMWPR